MTQSPNQQRLQGCVRVSSLCRRQFVLYAICDLEVQAVLTDLVLQKVSDQMSKEAVRVSGVCGLCESEW